MFDMTRLTVVLVSAALGFLSFSTVVLAAVENGGDADWVSYSSHASLNLQVIHEQMDKKTSNLPSSISRS